jgi:hypothetical protein
MDLEKEIVKIPLKCMHPKCLFEERECRSKFYWEWLQKNKLDCPKCCPKYRKSR